MQSDVVSPALNFNTINTSFFAPCHTQLMYLESMMLKWKKEDPKLAKAVDDAKKYVSKIGCIEGEILLRRLLNPYEP